VSTFGGYYIKDRFCFGGVVDRLNCTSRSDDGFEFFVITKLNNDLYYSNALFSGIIGLDVNLTSQVESIIEYLVSSKQIDFKMMSVYTNSTYGLVKLGQYDQNFIV